MHPENFRETKKNPRNFQAVATNRFLEQASALLEDTLRVLIGLFVAVDKAMVATNT